MSTTSNFSDNLDFLQTLPLLRDLSPRQLEQTAQLLQPRSLQAGETLMHSDSAGDAVTFILSGYVKVATERRDGAQLSLGLRGPGEILGEMSVVDAQVKSASIVALTACEVAWISREDFWVTLWDFSPIPYNLAHLLNERVRRLSAVCQSLSYRTAASRLAAQLSLLMQEFGITQGEDEVVELPFSLSASDLATLTSLNPDEIEHLLNEWTEQGIIEGSEGKIRIVNADGLSGKS